jgi:hypothetical protein
LGVVPVGVPLGEAEGLTPPVTGVELAPLGLAEFDGIVALILAVPLGVLLVAGDTVGEREGTRVGQLVPRQKSVGVIIVAAVTFCGELLTLVTNPSKSIRKTLPNPKRSIFSCVRSKDFFSLFIIL